jgi:hypothetical protein
MTLETAKRIVREQGEDSNKEARAVVRGGMTICETSADRRRTYLWLKVLPTETDEESSIELALKMHNQKKQPISKSSTKAITHPSKAMVEETSIIIHSEPTVTKKMDSLDSKEVHPFLQLIAYLKRKFDEFVKAMDELVEE